METRANPLLVGVFTLVVLAAAFGFIYWMGYGAGGNKISYRVEFTGEVTGLTKGSSVLYNGIRVGDVADIHLDPDDPAKIIAEIRIDPGFPVTDSTKAQLQFQGITGAAYVQLQPDPGQTSAPTSRTFWRVGSPC